MFYVLLYIVFPFDSKPITYYYSEKILKIVVNRFDLLERH